MPHRAKPPEYDRKLSRTLTLADGGKLRTLRDAANVLTGERFATVTKWAALEAAIELHMVVKDAAESETRGAVLQQHHERKARIRNGACDAKVLRQSNLR
jgi:hypothetical protein